MRELITMWRDTRMIMLVAVVAAVYAAVLIPFKGLTILPGLTSVRPANVFPVIFGLMFGPAAAWGAAIGNLIGDVFGGTFGPGSVGGFLGNFFFGLASYKLWGNLGPLSSKVEPDFREDAGRQVAEYLAVAAVASVGCAAIISWVADSLGLVPFPVLGPIISVNNFLAAAVLGPPLLYLTWPRVEDMGLLYPDVMRGDDLPDVDHGRQQVVAYGLAAVTVVWLLLGVFALPPDSTPMLVVGALAFVAVVALVALSGERLSEFVGVGAATPAETATDEEARA